ncbi:hypothetical protein [Micromonospora yangpuensis]|uniref:Uncharacterized protein n=1 Tax=Micromonospora yangpuensis TaxID=683228 RepID=A0A1C6V2T9_9ACTN|nr:hypothetical protein [Micromonospora yangpuensis]GGL97924.1 hypothetical protein GCM10012279_14220 [Micromonospora yangpuensis]SCL60220.1 hypothetical protein GA0070617_4318 [Micromonospora yangpuensis]
MPNIDRAGRLFEEFEQEELSYAWEALQGFNRRFGELRYTAAENHRTSAYNAGRYVEMAADSQRAAKARLEEIDLVEDRGAAVAVLARTSVFHVEAIKFLRECEKEWLAADRPQAAAVVRDVAKSQLKHLTEVLHAAAVALRPESVTETPLPMYRLKVRQRSINERADQLAASHTVKSSAAAALRSGTSPVENAPTSRTAPVASGGVPARSRQSRSSR